MGFIIIYVTHESKKEADRINKYLLDRKLIACTNIFPIKSAYWWNGKVENSDEFVSILKTRIENWKAVRDEVEKIHPYDTPCIMKINVEANAKYEKWIYDETNRVNK